MYVSVFYVYTIRNIADKLKTSTAFSKTHDLILGYNMTRSRIVYDCNIEYKRSLS